MANLMGAFDESTNSKALVLLRKCLEDQRKNTNSVVFSLWASRETKVSNLTDLLQHLSEDPDNC